MDRSIAGRARGLAERLAQRILLLLAITSLVAGAAALRVWTLLGGRMDPDIVMTEAASGIAGSALALVVVWLALVALTWAIGRRSRPGPLAAALATLSIALVVGGSSGVLIADARDPARVSWLAMASGALLAVIVTAHLAWHLGAIARRASAPRTDWSDDAPARAGRDRRWPYVAIALLAVVAVVPPAVRPPELDPDRVCEANVECRTIVVQADQRSDDPRGATTSIEYGYDQADGPRRGTLVIVAGGPGVSGIVTYRLIQDTLDARLLATYDVVVFDPRGVGHSGYRDCPVASDVYAVQLDLTVQPKVIGTFVERCIVEADVRTTDLARYGSDQVVEDIETIRMDLGVERIAVYGESYGTVVAQRYALAHPDRLAALILDGPLDAAHPADQLWSEAAAGFEDVLDQTFDACRRDPTCATDLPDPDAAWERVSADLHDRIRTARYADLDGELTDFPLFEQSTLRSIADALYDETGRMLVLRSVAAAARDDWVPLARLVHSGVQHAEASEAVSDFAYYATWCADRVVELPELDTESYLAAARTALHDRRLGEVYLSGAACHAWPLPPGPPPAASLPVSATFPVLILTATADPVTPPASARRLLERYGATTNAYLVETDGGAHLTFGRGAACPDGLVVGLLVDGIVPSSVVSSCPGAVIDPYIGLVRSADDDDPVGFRARALEAEILGHPDVVGWETSFRTTIGCRLGGRVVIDRNRAGGEVDIDQCEVVDGSPLTGRGMIGRDGSLTFEVRFPDGDLVHAITPSGRARWSGSFRGRAFFGEAP